MHLLKRFTCFLIVLPATFLQAQTLYYPPTSGPVWDTLSPSALNWCPDKVDALYDYLEQSHSKAFILLKDGKIVLERYFGTFTQDSLHVWNSAGKTLVGFTVGIAQQEGLLNIADTTSDYLGTGWTALTASQEEKITIRHQLTMTSGLNDGGSTSDCTDPACLTYLADPGMRWAYHNAPYTLLHDVLEQASGQSMNVYVNSRIKTPTGMDGFFVDYFYNKVYISKARSMARFGLLLLSGGNWDGTPVLSDAAYLSDMTSSSQSLNNSYGYLTWLNGKSSYMLPQTQFVFPGSVLPNAPADLYAAIGKNGQIINVVPSQNMVVVRMGDGSGNLVESFYNDTIWQKINELPCLAGTSEVSAADEYALYPVPATDAVNVRGLKAEDKLQIFTSAGAECKVTRNGNRIDLSGLEKGVYFLRITHNDTSKTLRLVIN